MADSQSESIDTLDKCDVDTLIKIEKQLNIKVPDFYKLTIRLREEILTHDLHQSRSH